MFDRFQRFFLFERLAAQIVHLAEREDRVRMRLANNLLVQQLRRLVGIAIVHVVEIVDAEGLDAARRKRGALRRAELPLAEEPRPLLLAHADARARRDEHEERGEDESAATHDGER